MEPIQDDPIDHTKGFRATWQPKRERFEWLTNTDYIKRLEAERDSLVAYLGETADAIENHNVKRKQVAALLRKTQARYR